MRSPRAGSSMMTSIGGGGGMGHGVPAVPGCPVGTGGGLGGGGGGGGGGGPHDAVDVIRSRQQR